MCLCALQCLCQRGYFLSQKSARAKLLSISSLGCSGTINSNHDRFNFTLSFLWLTPHLRILYWVFWVGCLSHFLTLHSNRDPGEALLRFACLIACLAIKKQRNCHDSKLTFDAATWHKRKKAEKKFRDVKLILTGISLDLSFSNNV